MRLHSIGLIAAHLATPAPDNVAPGLLITVNAIGPVRLGMTVAELRKSLPKVRMVNTTDGDGAGWVSLRGGPGGPILIQLDGWDETSYIPGTAKVCLILTYASKYRTQAGVHVGMQIRDVQTRWGKLIRFEHSSIESREYAIFRKMPKNMLVEIEYKGTYSKRSLANAVISSIWIMEGSPFAD